MTTTDTRIALITGANRGLGRSEALALAADGVDLIITYRTGEAEAQNVVEQIRAFGRRAVALKLDVTDTASFTEFASEVSQALSETWGRSDLAILINNAGAAAWTPLGQIEADEIRAVFDLHVIGIVMLTQALAPLLADGGRIVNTSTGLSRFVGANGYSVYAAAKGAVEVWTRYLAEELAPRGITVNTIAPGATGTDFGGGALRDNEGVRAQLGSTIAMGHVGIPDDIGNAVAAIVSPGMGWVTGQRIEASGGMRL